MVCGAASEPSSAAAAVSAVPRCCSRVPAGRGDTVFFGFIFLAELRGAPGAQGRARFFFSELPLRESSPAGVAHGGGPFLVVHVMRRFASEAVD